MNIFSNSVPVCFFWHLNTAIENHKLTPLRLSPSSSSEDPPEALLRRLLLSDILKMCQNKLKNVEYVAICPPNLHKADLKDHTHVCHANLCSPLFSRKNVFLWIIFLAQTLHEAKNDIRGRWRPPWTLFRRVSAPKCGRLTRVLAKMAKQSRQVEIFLLNATII